MNEGLKIDVRNEFFAIATILRAIDQPLLALRLDDLAHQVDCGDHECDDYCSHDANEIYEGGFDDGFEEAKRLLADAFQHMPAVAETIREFTLPV